MSLRESGCLSLCESWSLGLSERGSLGLSKSWSLSLRESGCLRAEIGVNGITFCPGGLPGSIGRVRVLHGVIRPPINRFGILGRRAVVGDLGGCSGKIKFQPIAPRRKGRWRDRDLIPTRDHRHLLALGQEISRDIAGVIRIDAQDSLSGGRNTQINLHGGNDGVAGKSVKGAILKIDPVRAYGSPNGRQSCGKRGGTNGSRRGGITKTRGDNILQVVGTSRRRRKAEVNQVLPKKNVVNQIAVIGHGLRGSRRIDDNKSQHFACGVPSDGNGMRRVSRRVIYAATEDIGASNTRSANIGTGVGARAVFHGH